MLRVLRILALTLVSCLQSRRQLAIENLALRHQLAVLEQAQTKRVRLGPADRALWVWLSCLWDDWRDVLCIVRPETVLRWHRKGFKLYWTWRSRRRRHGRPAIDQEVRALIRRMSRANPTWGAPRIHGELLKLGIDVSRATVSKYMVRHRKPPSQTWRTFLDNHARELASVDFFTVPTATFRVLFAFVVLSHERRRVVHVNVTANPSAAWTAQQVVEAFPWETAPRYLLRDRDGIYGDRFRRRVRGMGIAEVLIAPRSPWQSPYVERLIGSIRRELLDRVIVLDERHLLRLLRQYFETYYHPCRTHLGLDKDCPTPRQIEPPETGEVVELPVLNGLHHRYTRRAA